MEILSHKCRNILGVALLGTLLLTLCGCEAFYEALNGELEGTDDPTSEEYQPRYVIGIFTIVTYPRATELEKAVSDTNGQEIYINTNNNFSSQHLKDARVKLRPGNPEICDLEFKLDRFGKVQWQNFAGYRRDDPVALVVDGRLVAKFIPDKAETEGNWVPVRVGISPHLARGIVKYASKNYAYYNPDSKNWFKKW